MPNQNPQSDLAAQAKKLGLGICELTAAVVASAPTDILPLATVEARGIFPYRIDEIENVLYVAVANAKELSKPAPSELQAQRTKGRKLVLELTDASSFSQLLPDIRKRLADSGVRQNTPNKNSGLEKDAAAPVLTAKSAGATAPALTNLETASIPRSVLLKLPEDVATKFRVVAYEASADGMSVKLASDKPDDAGVQRIVSVIRDKRGVTASVVPVSSEQLAAVLAAYKTSDDPISIAPKPVVKTVPIASEDRKESPTSMSSPEPAKAPQPVAVGVPLPPLPTMPKPVAPVSATPPVPKVDLPKPQPLSPVSAPREKPAIQSGTPPMPVSASEKAAVPAVQPMATMPVDTSRATAKFDESKPAKITLSAPLTAPSGSAFPLPKLTSAARTYLSQNGMTAPLAPTPAQPKPLVPAQTPPPVAPVVTSTSPVLPATPAQSSAPSDAKPAETPTPPTFKPLSSPLSLQPTNAVVQKNDVANKAAFAPLQTISPTEDQQLDTIVGSTIRSAEELETVVRTGLVPKILAAILQYAVNVGASDVHVEATTDSLRIRFRVDGILQDILKAPLGLDAPFVSRVKILSGMKIDEQRIPQDGRFTAVTGNREVDFRVSTLPAIHGEKVVMRILDKSIGVRAIDQLGFDATSTQRVAAAVAKPYGIILVTGPTGSGKTTTLYAMLGTLNKPGVNIVTLEDPVEYELPGITQTQVKPKIGFSFAEGLRSVLRQDPDIVMVGEIRDRETASLATHAALTGHLVLSTLHTNTAAGAIPRFLNMGVEAFLVASSIDAVIGQRLVRRLCDKCKQPAPVAETVLKDVAASLNTSVVPEVKQVAAAQMQFFAPHGCNECHSGYRGRLGIYEVMTVTPEIEALAAKKTTVTEIQTVAEQQGMVTMKQDGILKALQGLTSLDEVLRVTTE